MGGADDGFVSLHEFSPDIAELMDSFYACLCDKHEGKDRTWKIVTAWRQTFDPDKSLKVPGLIS